jgi:hypothetical protein
MKKAGDGGIKIERSRSRAIERTVKERRRKKKLMKANTYLCI